LKRLCGRHGFDPARIEFVDIDDFDFTGVKTIRGSAMTYARLLIPAIFPLEDDAIYCDCDVLFLRGLRDLLKADMGDKLVLGIQDSTVGLIDNDCQWDDLSPDLRKSRYFNGGILRINLDLWKREGVAQRALEIARLEPDKCLFWDQTILNYLCAGRVAFVEKENNLQIRDEEMTGHDDVNIHFLGGRKPWVLYSGKRAFSLWRKHYRENVAMLPGFYFNPLFWFRALILRLAAATGGMEWLRKLRRRIAGW
jgi:lipopolysaccharide biosynthesis glycosyltransferase